MSNKAAILDKLRNYEYEKCDCGGAPTGEPPLLIERGGHHGNSQARPHRRMALDQVVGLTPQ